MSSKENNVETIEDLKERARKVQEIRCQINELQDSIDRYIYTGLNSEQSQKVLSMVYNDEDRYSLWL